MRIESIDIAGFGRLQDVRVDLAPGLVVVLAPNEAGKSTLHRAMRAALYGIDVGGPGRPVERSEWARWRPWNGGRYGVSMTYTLDDGRRVRVARSLEQREERAQVVELGGREITDDMRVRRVVQPGVRHLGIDEAVFCATACLGDDGLRVDGPEGPAARSAEVQHAVERLADAAGRATAAEALTRLRAASERVGTERAGKSTLGAASRRLQQLDTQLDAARTRLAALALDRERLRALEATAADAAERQDRAERSWLCGRLAAIAATRDELRQAQEEERLLLASIASLEPAAGVPIDREERVTTLGGEMRAASETVATARAAAHDAIAEMAEIDVQRRHLATSIHALGRVPRIDLSDLEEAATLRGVLAVEASLAHRSDAAATAASHLDSLRREIAAMGLGGVPIGSADMVAELVTEAADSERSARLGPVAIAIWVLIAALAAGAALSGQRQLAVAMAAAGGGVGLLLLVARRVGLGPSATATRRLQQMCPGLDVSPAGLAAVHQRLGELRSLHTDLNRQHALVDAGREELDAAAIRAEELATRAMALAARLRLTPDEEGAVSGLVGGRAHLARAAAALRAVDAAAVAGRRRAELEDEDNALARRVLALRPAGDAADAAEAHRDAILSELGTLLDGTGVVLDPDDVGAAISAFRTACSVRRRLESERARLIDVRRRTAARGRVDDATLAAEARRLGEELSRRAGDPDALENELPLDPGRLQELEVLAVRARQEADAAARSAAELAARLEGALDGAPAISDLEDERAACQQVRDRCLQQLRAIDRAAVAVSDAARRVHREIAPRLAASIGARLALLTDGRYDEVFVDAEHLTVLLRSPERPQLVPADLLSRGTRDQVVLLLRLALVEVLSGAGETVPLLLDDPLPSADPLRRAGALTFLSRLAETTQVVLTTSDPTVVAHVEDQARPCHVVRLGGGSGRRQTAARELRASAILSGSATRRGSR